jgi:hypothetical protein
MYTHFVVYECADKALESYMTDRFMRHTYCFNQSLQIKINFELLVTIRLKLALKLHKKTFKFENYRFLYQSYKKEAK